MGSKKIVGTLAKFDIGHQLVKKMGLPDPSGDLIYGKNKALSPAEQAQKQSMDMAKQQAEQAQQQMQLQVNQANEAAKQGAQQVQNNQDREIAQQAAVEAGQIKNDKPTVELADTDVVGPTGQRKKYRSQMGGAKGKASVRV